MCSYSPGQDNESRCTYSDADPPRCQCKDCDKKKKASIDYKSVNYPLNRPTTNSQYCVDIPPGDFKCESTQRVAHPDDQNGTIVVPCVNDSGVNECTCEDCGVDEDGDIKYGCPMNRLDFFDPDQQPSHDCVHEALKVSDSTYSTKCFRRKCRDEPGWSEALVYANAPDGTPIYRDQSGNK